MFAAGAQHTVDARQALGKGLIVVVSINAFLFPQPAALVAKCIKADFYQAAFQRGLGGGDQHRVAALICDEFHLAVTVGGTRYDDAVALPLLRQFRAGVIAATQTIASLDRVVGVANRRVLLPNFNTVFFMRSSEPETAEWAGNVLGTRIDEEVIRDRPHGAGGGIFGQFADVPWIRKSLRKVCTPAALARLEPGQAFFYRQFEPSSIAPVWIAEM